MTHLPTVTLMAIDTVKPFHTLLAMEKTLYWSSYREAILLTDVEKFKGIASEALKHGVRVCHHKQSDKVHLFRGIRRKFFPDYELAVLREPAFYIDSSSHVLYMEGDAGVLNPAAWKPAWLRYDYIGAPWPDHHDPGWPPCNDSNRVGNAGFSLRSAKFCALARQAADEHPDDPARYINDAWACRTMRPWLESNDVRFAPPSVAAKFSCENQIYSGQFGFHGKETVDLNNWGGWLWSLSANLRKQYRQ